MRCWGDNIAGPGTESTSNVSNAVSGSDVILPTGVSIKDFTVGSVRTCIVTTDDAIYCWGYGDYGALGNGSAEIIGDGCIGSNTASSLRDCSGAVSEMGDSLVPVDIGSDESISEITMGALSICVRMSDGSVKCWGDGSDGILGTGNTENIGDQLDEMGDNLLSVDLGANFAASDIDCFGAVCCAVSEQGKVKCWGRSRSYGSAWR